MSRFNTTFYAFLWVWYYCRLNVLNIWKSKNYYSDSSFMKKSTFNFSDSNLSAKQKAAEFFKNFAHKVCSVNAGCCFWRPESKIQIRLFTKKTSAPRPCICYFNSCIQSSAMLSFMSILQTFFCPLQLRLSCLTWKYVGSNQSWTYFLKIVYRIQQFCFFRIHFSAQIVQKLYMQTFRVFCCLCE